jgi:hypothetical protein
VISLKVALFFVTLITYVGNVGGLNGSVVEVENNVKVFGHFIHFVSKIFLQKIDPHLREHWLDWIEWPSE